jgi:hypothetical protein
MKINKEKIDTILEIILVAAIALTIAITLIGVVYLQTK